MGYINNDECLSKALPNEPIFVLLGRDETAAQTVMHWIENNMYRQPPEKIQEAWNIANVMIKERYNVMGQLKIEREIADKQEEIAKLRMGEGNTFASAEKAIMTDYYDRNRDVKVPPTKHTVKAPEKTFTRDEVEALMTAYLEFTFANGWTTRNVKVSVLRDGAEKFLNDRI